MQTLMDENDANPTGMALIYSEPARQGSALKELEELEELEEQKEQEAAEALHLPAPLRHYQHARVTIYYTSGVTDTGTLAYLDRVWAELLKDNGERLLIPMQAIRILKLVKVGETHTDAAMLLRAAEGAAPERNTGKT